MCKSFDEYSANAVMVDAIDIIGSVNFEYSCNAIIRVSNDKGCPGVKEEYAKYTKALQHGGFEGVWDEIKDRRFKEMDFRNYRLEMMYYFHMSLGGMDAL